MPKKLAVGGKLFKSQKDAEGLFYAMRDKYWVSKEKIENSTDYLLLKDLYEEYCRVTDWNMKGTPSYFEVRNIARGSGGKGGTTQGFVVIFDNGEEEEFSARNAIKYIANSQIGQS